MTCPNCGFISDETQKFCQQCGFDLRTLQWQQQLLQTDPALSSYSQKESSTSLVCRISGIATLLCIALMYFWLEDKLPEIFGTVGLLTFFPSLITWLISWLLCLGLRAKIKKLMRAYMKSAPIDPSMYEKRL
jgi:RNA polymerase subunit RPABC4/transcription elongation factor Spt4